MNCYYLKEYLFNKSIFNNIDATYIIHLENNGRLDSIMTQLNIYQPTKKIYILFNKGYKKCKKNMFINKPPLDLIDSFFTIFKDAYNKKYNNILILEDDFIFDENILNKYHTDNIDYFIDYKNKRNEIFIYYLGVLPYIQTYYGEYHNKIFLSTGSHSCIYPRSFIRNLIDNIDQQNINDWDVYLNTKYTKYKYYIPLCYQTFPETENSKYWNKGFFLHLLTKLKLKYIKLMNLDKNPQPGFDIFEYSSKFIFLFSILFIFIIIIYIQYFFNKKYLYYYLLIFILYPMLIFIIFFFIIYIQIIYYKIK